MSASLPTITFSGSRTARGMSSCASVSAGTPTNLPPLAGRREPTPTFPLFNKIEGYWLVSLCAPSFYKESRNVTTSNNLGVMDTELHHPKEERAIEKRPFTLPIAQKMYKSNHHARESSMMCVAAVVVAI
eukprot:TRINITY_DN4994_c0_g2_i4.p1 TRINITY_DN4994_c0_g2~~TRINITY_DN4994_c0_g2_i4.p1  ORF type:complete len:130 (+),score=1.45 TRINITY_DN4994_c0_g2_i4:214-603(+)